MSLCVVGYLTLLAERVPSDGLSMDVTAYSRNTTHEHIYQTSLHATLTVPSV
jgi:hypothetical protein